MWHHSMWERPSGRPRKLLETAFDKRYEDGTLRERATFVRRAVVVPVKRAAKAVGRAACDAFSEAKKLKMHIG